MRHPRRRTRSIHTNSGRGGNGGGGGGGGGGGCLGRLRHRATSAVIALHVLNKISSHGCGVAAAAAAAAPPPLYEAPRTGHALDAPAAAVGAVTNLEVDLDGGEDLSMAELFSSEWAAEFGAGDPGCDLARGSFMWRGQGFGSNVNNLLNAWVYAIAVEDWADLAVVIEEHQMAHVECGERSPGDAVTEGWNCLFLPMPHLCTFDTGAAWEMHMVSEGLQRADLAEAARLDQDAVRFHAEDIVAALDGSDVDHLGAKAVMAKYLWSYMTPWLQADIDVVARAPESDAFEKSPYLALHVRRGDKVQNGEAKLHICEEYLSAAVAYLEGDETQLNVEDIRGIWVASDDSGVVDRIKEIAPSYLPNVDNSTIFWAAGGVEGGPEIPRVTTRTDKETYEGFVYMFADLHQCTRADVFVGTFSSNMGRLLALLRESIGLKPRHSSISIDARWWAGRQRQRRALAA